MKQPIRRVLCEVCLENKVQIRHENKLRPRCTGRESMSAINQLPLDLILDTFNIPVENWSTCGYRYKLAITPLVGLSQTAYETTAVGTKFTLLAVVNQSKEEPRR